MFVIVLCCFCVVVVNVLIVQLNFLSKFIQKGRTTIIPESIAAILVNKWCCRVARRTLNCCFASV